MSVSPDGACARQLFRAGFSRGALAIFPLLIATGTWALVTGVAMVKSGLTDSLALTMSLLVYAGSAQLTTLPLIVSGAPLWLIFAAGLVVNLRFVIFAAALHPFLRGQSWPRRLALGYFTTDMAFVLFMPRYGHERDKGTPEQLGFYVGCLAPAWFVWQALSILGIYLGAWIPQSWSLEFAAILALLALTLPLITSRPVLLAAVAAGGVAWLAQPLPLRLGLVLSVLVGIVVGMWAERRLGLVTPAPDVATPGAAAPARTTRRQ